jgi:uncharacterized caspase-like protein
MPAKHALVIGNSDFADPKLARLVTPAEDATDFAAVLRAGEIGGFDSVTALVNETAENVRTAIEAFFADKGPNDLLLLYFSGHGIRDDQGQLYLAVKDTQTNRLRSKAIPAAFITESMDHSRSRRQVLILDCCHSGAFAQGAKAAVGVSAGTGPAFEGTGFGRVVLTASDSTQYAWEGERIVGEAQNSVFTKFLVEGLQTGAADADRDGQITIDELYDYVFERVRAATPKQTPGKWTYRQQGDLILARSVRPPAELPREVSEAAANPSPEVRVEAVRRLSDLLRGADREVASLARSALEGLAADSSRRVATAASAILAAAQPSTPTDPLAPLKRYAAPLIGLALLVLVSAGWLIAQSGLLAIPPTGQPTVDVVQATVIAAQTNTAQAQFNAALVTQQAHSRQTQTVIAQTAEAFAVTASAFETQRADAANAQTQVALDATATESVLVSDLDNDGLSYRDELQRGTRPDTADTDGDGLLDGADPDPLRAPTATPAFTPTATATATRTPTATSIAAPFLGNWVIEKAAATTLTRLSISVDSTTITVQAWDAATTKCEWGKVTTSLSDAEDGVLTAEWAARGETHTLRRAEAKLQLTRVSKTAKTIETFVRESRLTSSVALGPCPGVFKSP